jgi:hypothetical protein
MRDFWGVAFFAFTAAFYVLYRTTPPPAVNATGPVDIVGALFWILVLGLLLLFDIGLIVLSPVAALRVAVSGRWRYLSRERVLLATVVALLWSMYSALDGPNLDVIYREWSHYTYTPNGSEWWLNLPPVVDAGLYGWGFVANGVLVYWLLGAIHRLWENQTA